MLSEVPFTKENLDKYLKRLSPDSRRFIEEALADGAYETLYSRVRKLEAENKDILIEYQGKKPGVINKDNTASIIAAIRKRKSVQ